MHPILIDFGSVKIYSYGFLIMIGAILAMIYTAKRSKKDYNLSVDSSYTMFIIIFAGAFLGGKVFYFFENPAYFFEHPGELWGSRGFVFYGSLIFSIVGILWFFRSKKLPILGMLDIIAFTTGIVHVFGRMGCFMAGCCYGIPTNSDYGVVFTDANAMAKPLDTHLHPTQLYSAGMILSILLTIYFIKRKQQFHGQLFLIYVMMYAVGRAIIEVFRGDLSRGFVINDWVSHSQFISLIILIISAYFYVRIKGDSNYRLKMDH